MKPNRLLFGINLTPLFNNLTYLHYWWLRWWYFISFIFSSILSPLGLSKVVAYFTPHQKNISTEQVYKYAAILVFVQVFNFCVTGNLKGWVGIIGVRMQAALRCLLYRKALRTPSSCGFNIGNVVTLITKDISVLEQNMWIIKDFILVFIEFGTMIYLLYNCMGNTAFVGIGIILFTIAVQGKNFWWFFRYSCKRIFSISQFVFEKPKNGRGKAIRRTIAKNARDTFSNENHKNVYVGKVLL